MVFDCVVNIIILVERWRLYFAIPSDYGIKLEYTIYCEPYIYLYNIWNIFVCVGTVNTMEFAYRISVMVVDLRIAPGFMQADINLECDGRSSLDYGFKLNAVLCSGMF